MYKQAIREGLRFPSAHGMLTIEQLYSLKEDTLEVMLVSTQDAIDAESQPGSSLDFLKKVKRETKTLKANKLRFEILKDVFLTKESEREEKEGAKEVKEHNEKILSRIASKKDQALDNMSEEELRKLLK